MTNRKKNGKPVAERERILAVDDSPDALEVVKRNLNSEGYLVVTATGVAEAIKILETEHIDLVITDLKMPKVNGIELVRCVRENFKDTEVMMITGYATIEGAVEAMKTGAEEYLSKPFTDEELFTAVKKVLEKLHMRRVARSKAVVTPRTPSGFIGDSPAMERVYQAIAKAARSKATVLITGESGTGKELVARAIHYSGQLAASPFIPVNCGGIPENLLESELFGYTKGAFTGAVETRAGFFQTADGGTIFLDEVGEMSLSMQVKLLRVLQEKEICMVGSSRPRKVDVRILAATNKELDGMISKGSFREDLYYRLNVIPIGLPPLRERGDDILKLVNQFAKKFSVEAERRAPRFTDKALEMLGKYSWPGNVRELQNVINRSVVMFDDDIIDAPDLPAFIRTGHVRELGLERSLAEVEAEYIANVLASVDGNKTRAAQILGVDRKTLRSKVKQVGADSK